MKRKGVLLTAGAIFLGGILGCNTQHKVQVEPVEVKPIHITIDVNVKVDRALDDFFDEIDQAEDQIEVTPEETEVAPSDEAAREPQEN
jgi:hypothetical protein